MIVIKAVWYVNTTDGSASVGNFRIAVKRASDYGVNFLSGIQNTIDAM